MIENTPFEFIYSKASLSMDIIPVKNTIMNSVTYILYAEDVDYCVLIDCGEWKSLRPFLEKIGKSVNTVLLTHRHSDHIYGLNEVLHNFSNVKVATTNDGHEEIQDSSKNISYYHGYPFVVKDYRQIVLCDKLILHFEGFADIEIMATPDHDTSCLTYKIGNNLFTGDSYILGIKPFTKFLRGNKEQALKSMVVLSEIEKQGFSVRCGHHSYL